VTIFDIDQTASDLAPKHTLETKCHTRARLAGSDNPDLAVQTAIEPKITQHSFNRIGCLKTCPEDRERVGT
jgi:hypothetical protein